ncbi:hypothetical protein ACU686_07460 [Yinghuangia aomiensis]
MHFNSANPAGWTACQLNSTLFRVNSDGTATALSSAPMADCLDAAHAKADRGAAVPWAAITASGNYRVRLGIAGSYNGTAVLGYAGSSPRTYTWASDPQSLPAGPGRPIRRPGTALSGRNVDHVVVTRVDRLR